MQQRGARPTSRRSLACLPPTLQPQKAATNPHCCSAVSLSLPWPLGAAAKACAYAAGDVCAAMGGARQPQRLLLVQLHSVGGGGGKHGGEPLLGAAGGELPCPPHPLLPCSVGGQISHKR